MSAITAIATSTSTAAATPEAEKAKRNDKVAHDFEELFLRQILQSSHALGQGEASGYAGMALDALASGLADAGGIGLARTIRNVIDRAQAPEIKKEPATTISSKAP